MGYFDEYSYSETVGSVVIFIVGGFLKCLFCYLLIALQFFCGWCQSICGLCNRLCCQERDVPLLCPCCDDEEQ